MRVRLKGGGGGDLANGQSWKIDRTAKNDQLTIHTEQQKSMKLQ